GNRKNGCGHRNLVGGHSRPGEKPSERAKKCLKFRLEVINACHMPGDLWNVDLEQFHGQARPSLRVMVTSLILNWNSLSSPFPNHWPLKPLIITIVCKSQRRSFRTNLPPANTLSIDSER